jgi:hypothetical protein
MLNEKGRKDTHGCGAQPRKMVFKFFNHQDAVVLIFLIKAPLSPHEEANKFIAKIQKRNEYLAVAKRHSSVAAAEELQNKDQIYLTNPSSKETNQGGSVERWYF